MKTDEIIILLIIITGIVFMLVPILKDPIHAFKSVLRGMKSSGNWRITILFFPIWGPMWVIDRLLGTKIFIDDLEDASITQEIDFTEYQKYILINSTDLNNLKYVLNGFQKEHDPNEYNSDLSQTKILAALTNRETVLRLDDYIGFETFKLLVQFIDNSPPPRKVYNIKGVLINKMEIEKSFFIQHDTSYFMKLVGKTYTNKKMYAMHADELNGGDRIYLNSNLDYIKKFNFEEFIEDINGLNFNELIISPVHNML